MIGAIAVRSITASMTVEGGSSRDVFLRSVHEHLNPTLRRGEVVLMDDPGTHHGTGVRETIEAVGASVLHMPRFAPDLDPIELCGSRFQDVLLTLGARARAGLREKSAIAAKLITRGWSRHRGHRHRQPSRWAP